MCQPRPSNLSGNAPAEPTREEIAVADDSFCHGGSYPPENGKIRPTPCSSCAFISAPGSIRPDGVTIAATEQATADYDDFLCHCLDENGRSYSCAGWAARFGESAPEVRQKTRGW